MHNSRAARRRSSTTGRPTRAGGRFPWTRNAPSADDQEGARPRGAFLCMARSEEPTDDVRQHARQPAAYPWCRQCAVGPAGLRGLCDKVIEQSERAVRFREASMRLPILWLFLIAASLLGEIQAASTQSPTTYPWCLRYFAYDGATPAISPAISSA
jgi:hypothetical protein